MAAAAVGMAGHLGSLYWQEGLRLLSNPGTGMSGMVLAGIEAVGPMVAGRLFRPGMPRFLIAANSVDEDAAPQTQGPGARRLGRRLLIEAGRGDRRWVDAHLNLQLFDTSGEPALTAANFAAVAYASSRMLHAWDVPAWVGGAPYVDAFYTCNCPAVPLAERGCAGVIALANEPVLYADIFGAKRVPERWQGATIHVVAPEVEPSELGVSYTQATPEGLAALLAHGRERGRLFLRDFERGAALP
jgi:hypothetical protein